MAIKAGTAIPQPVANNTEDEYFLGISPDKHIIFARLAHGFSYNIMSKVIGGTEVVLAQVFPPYDQAPQFKGITSDNRVIFSEYVSYQQGSNSLNIYSVKTDGSNQAIVANNPPFNEEFCLITSDNRILFTEKSTHVINGQYETFGDIYSVNADGSDRLLLNPGPRHYNDICRGFTADNRVVFTRTIVPNYDSEGVDEIYSVIADGKSQPVLLAGAPSGPYGSTITNNYFERVTPGNRVLFRTITSTPVSGGTLYTGALNSILPDGTGLVQLTTNINVVGGVTAGDLVYYNAPVPAMGPSAYNIFTVPAKETCPIKQISTSSHLEYVNFIYISR